MAATSRIAASRFSSPQQANAPAQLPGLSRHGDTADPARMPWTSGSPETKPAMAAPPASVSPCGPGPPESNGPSASANDRCRCAPLPAPPANGTGENDTPRPCLAAARPIRSRASTVRSAVVTGSAGGSETSNWSVPYSACTCSAGIPA